MREITLEKGTSEFEHFTRDFITRKELGNILNKSNVWMEKRFIKDVQFQKDFDVLKVKVLAPFVNADGVSVLARDNVYIYFNREFIKRYFECSDAYKIEEGMTKKYQYDARCVMHLYDIDITKIVPLAKGKKKGGIRWSTALKKGYLVMFTREGDIFFYDGKNE